MQKFEDLDVYRLSHRLAVAVHRMTLDDLPKFEMYEVGSQIRRASKSVPANIVEGYGRKQYQQEYIKFLTYALASVDETKAHLLMLSDSGSLSDKVLYKELMRDYEYLREKLYRFRSAVKSALR